MKHRHLHAAAARGDHDGIRHALRHGTDVNARDSLGASALHHALVGAATRSPAIVPRAGIATVELLLEAGADLALKDSFGRRAIHYAASIPNVEFLRLLARLGANVRQVSDSNSSTVVTAAYQPASPGKLRVLEYLALSGADLDLGTTYSETPLSVCLFQGDFASVRHLLEVGADPAPLAWTPLHRAVAFGSIDEVAALAHTASDINQPPDRWGHSPWLLAVRVGDQKKVKLLAERGADLAESDRNGRGALHLAAETDSSALPWLIHHGADLHATGNRHATPLHTATEHDAVNAVRQLLAAGADPQRENHYQARPINHARSVATLRLLMEAGADLDFVDGCGDWPLKNAAEDNDPERVAWLLAHGAKVDHTSTGATALHAAMQADAREVMVQLLAVGANPNAQDVDGWTAFFSARSREAIHLLRKAGGDPLIRDEIGGAPVEWLDDGLLQKALSEPLPAT